MSKRIVLVAFNGEPMCFVHVLLNALDLKEKGHEVKVVIEGAACVTINDLAEEGHQFYKLYQKVREQGLIDAVCRACATKLGALEGVVAQGLPLGGGMKGHPSLAGYLERAYEVITF